MPQRKAKRKLDPVRGGILGRSIARRQTGAAAIASRMASSRRKKKK